MNLRVCEDCSDALHTNIGTNRSRTYYRRRELYTRVKNSSCIAYAEELLDVLNSKSSSNLEYIHTHTHTHTQQLTILGLTERWKAD